MVDKVIRILFIFFMIVVPGAFLEALLSGENIFIFFIYIIFGILPLTAVLTVYDWVLTWLIRHKFLPNTLGYILIFIIVFTTTMYATWVVTEIYSKRNFMRGVVEINGFIIAICKQCSILYLAIPCVLFAEYKFFKWECDRK